LGQNQLQPQQHPTNFYSNQQHLASNPPFLNPNYAPPDNQRFQGSIGIQGPPTSFQSQSTGIQPPPTGIQPPPTGIQPPPTGIQPPPTGIQPPPTGSSQQPQFFNNNQNSIFNHNSSTLVRGPPTASEISQRVQQTDQSNFNNQIKTGINKFKI